MIKIEYILVGSALAVILAGAYVFSMKASIWSIHPELKESSLFLDFNSTHQPDMFAEYQKGNYTYMEFWNSATGCKVVLVENNEKQIIQSSLSKGCGGGANDSS